MCKNKLRARSRYANKLSSWQLEISKKNSASKGLKFYVCIMIDFLVTEINYVMLNTQSLGKKFTIVADCILTNNFNFFAAVETWHDSDLCPHLVACTPSGY